MRPGEGGTYGAWGNWLDRIDIPETNVGRKGLRVIGMYFPIPTCLMSH